VPENVFCLNSKHLSLLKLFYGQAYHLFQWVQCFHLRRMHISEHFIISSLSIFRSRYLILTISDHLFCLVIWGFLLLRFPGWDFLSWNCLNQS
jgi:hypothetical protein